MSALVRSVNASRSASVHQSVEATASVVLGALVVEPVPDLVADDAPDGTVVRGVVGLGVEEGRLEDRGGEDDLVARGVVERVDRLGEGEPLLAVRRLEEATPVVVLLERRRARGRCP